MTASTTVRSRDVAAVLVARQPELPSNPVKLNALLYLTQAWHLAITDRPLFADAIVADAAGPRVTGLP